MERKESGGSEERSAKPWLWLVPGNGPENGETTPNPADSLIIRGWHQSVFQAIGEKFKRRDAEDIASEAMFGIMELVVEDPTLIERLDEFERLRGNAVKTRCFSWRRSGKRAIASEGGLSRFLQEHIREWMLSDQRVEFNTSSSRLGRAMAQLSSDEQVAVFLRHALGWPPREIALHTDEPVSTIKGRINKGLKKLREIFLADRSTDPTETLS